MDCLEAQRIVSATLDGEAISPDALANAKAHCKECDECGVFVSTLVALRRTPLPEPPEDLVERIVARLQASPAPAPAVANQRTADTKPVPPVVGTVEIPTTTVMADKPTNLRALLLDPRYRRSVIAWSGAAAAVFVIAGVAAVTGARDVLLSQPTKTLTVSGVTAPTESTLEAQQDTAGSTAMNSTAARKSEAMDTALTVVGGLIEIDGVVYRSTGSAQNTDLSGLDALGSTLTSLDTQDEPERYAMKGTEDGSRAYLELDSGVIGFDRVARTVGDTTYALQSGPIASFDRGVTLPSDITEPTAADGSPTFEQEDGEEGIYVLAGRSLRDGIALPPGADRSAGAGWTWWEPVRR